MSTRIRNVDDFRQVLKDDPDDLLAPPKTFADFANATNFNGFFIRMRALDEVSVLAYNIGITHKTRLLDEVELMRLRDAADTSGIPKGHLVSFAKADAVLKEVNEDEEFRYLAVEISFTVNGRDTRRAIRNAEFLTRFTHKPAYPAVMGARLDNHIRHMIDNRQVHWHELGPDLINPE